MASGEGKKILLVKLGGLRVDVCLVCLVSEIVMTSLPASMVCCNFIMPMVVSVLFKNSSKDLGSLLSLSESQLLSEELTSILSGSSTGHMISNQLP